jgi:phosphoglycolate phosphatase
MTNDLRTELVVTDVDNTLFDWMGIWAGAFGAMVRALVDQTDRPADEWFAAARRVHARRGATECPTFLEDLAAAAEWPGHADRHAVLSRAAAIYRRYWDVHLAPYAGVRQALAAIAERGIPIVAYTESDAAVTAARLTRMGLAGVIRIVFGRAAASTATHHDWSLITPPARSSIAIDLVPQEDAKPSPLGLRQILGRCAVPADLAVYVGDHLWNDVAMAQRLGVRALWAAYGAARQAEHLDLLHRVAHAAGADLRGPLDTHVAVQPQAALDRPLDLLDHVGHAAAFA